MNVGSKDYLKVSFALLIIAAALYNSSIPYDWRRTDRSHPLFWLLYGVNVFDLNRPLVVGVYFDIWSLGKEFILFAQSAFVIIPCVLIIRRIALHSSRLIRLSFAFASVYALSYPATYLFLFGYDVCRYIQKMGFTYWRIKGIFAAGFYGTALIAFAAWLLVFSGRRMEFSDRARNCFVNFCTGLSLFFCIIFLGHLLHFWHYDCWAYVSRPAAFICFPGLLVVPFAIGFAYTSKSPSTIKWFRVVVNGFGLFGILSSIGTG